MASNKYSFTSYDKIPPSLKDYVLDVSGEECIEALPLIDINNFLNGIETWDAEDELFEAIANMSPNRSRSNH